MLINATINATIHPQPTLENSSNSVLVTVIFISLLDNRRGMR